MNAIYTHFSKTVDDYDTVADRVVMRNEELHDCLLKSIPFPVDAPLQILDLGCGTGQGMKKLLERFPKALVVGVDFSPKMILKSMDNLQKFKGRFKLVKRNFEEMEFEEKYDVVVSAVAIHNSTDRQKEKLFGKIFGALKKDGVFINADFVKGETPNVEAGYLRIYRRYLERNLLGEELLTWLKHAFEEDQPMKLSRQFKLLEKHGFKIVDLKWQFNNMAVYLANK